MDSSGWWRLLLGALMAADLCASITVECPRKRAVAILFQAVTLDCKYQTSSTQAVVLWKYKSYCRDPVTAALNPSSADNILAQNNPNYDPNIECADSQRTVRSVASKDRSAVTLGPEYQGRKISIINDADLSIAQTAWGDSGVYICSVTSSSDLTGNTECYTEVIVLERKSNTTDLLPEVDLLVMEDWLLVLLVVLGFLMLLLLIGICWCQCCPHTCCCFVSCPCCPDRCCCPRALYEAGKAVKKGVAGQYAASMYPPSMYGQTAYSAVTAMPMLPLHNGVGPAAPGNGYGREYDAGGSSVGQGSQVPLLRDQDVDHTRSGYRIQVDPDGNATRAIYYMERELANLDPTRPANYNRLDAMSEVSSLHDSERSRAAGRAPPPALSTVYDQDEAMSTISSVSQHVHRRPDDRRHDDRRHDDRRGADSRGRARSMDNLDDIGRRYDRNDRNDRDEYRRRPEEPRGRRGSDDGWSSSARSGNDRGYDRVYDDRGHDDRGHDDRRRRDYSPDDRHSAANSGLAGRRSRSRDDLMDLERERRYGDGGRGGRDYDDGILREAMERKKMSEQQRAHSRDRLDMERPPPLPASPPSGYLGRHDDPLPPPYSDSESMSSAKKSNLRKNGAVSRESLVV